ncbi:hypothetical protein B0A49_08725 [Cryomyces minteri]|uniref:Potassium channel tetramerisation-type BTB domain-containing protein n=1 Tax=Cryomyces minteri TaxID=331657 RepID=A0A4U0WV57_9PEZI|nr:hypothetical protein B0A49_08725 [Cryomyces minteri]
MLRPNPLQPEPENHAGSKRRFDHESPSVTLAAQTSIGEQREPPNKRQSKSASSSIASVASSNPHPSPRYYPAAAMSGRSKAPRSKDIIGNPPASSSSRRNVNRSAAETPLVERPRTVHTDSSSIDMVLPAGKVFPIQIGSELFRLSGASISSDAPSYFSQFFEEQLRRNNGAGDIRTLYIDRDPVTFRDISLHLQGYHIEPQDGRSFVKLFADAQFYSLPRLSQQLLNSSIHITVGDRAFQIPRSLFSSPGDTPNYFTLGFAIFFSTPSEVFPGLDRRGLLRPPSILPPTIPGRSADTFAELLHVLKGYPLHIRNEGHRAELLRDARYFHLKGLEQKLIPYRISYNLARQQEEILLPLEYVCQTGISIREDFLPEVRDSSSSSSPESPDEGPTANAGWICYQRPFIDEKSYPVILEIGEESTRIDFRQTGDIRADFCGQMRARFTSLLKVIADKAKLPLTQLSGSNADSVRVKLGPEADITLDGVKYLPGDAQTETACHMEGSEEEGDRSMLRRYSKRKRGAANDGKGEENVSKASEWIMRKGHWRLRLQPAVDAAAAAASSSGGSGMEVVLHAVKLEAFSSERARNAQAAFLC